MAGPRRDAGQSSGLARRSSSWNRAEATHSPRETSHTPSEAEGRTLWMPKTPGEVESAPGKREDPRDNGAREMDKDGRREINIFVHKYEPASRYEAAFGGKQANSRASTSKTALSRVRSRTIQSVCLMNVPDGRLRPTMDLRRPKLIATRTAFSARRVRVMVHRYDILKDIHLVRCDPPPAGSFPVGGLRWCLLRPMNTAQSLAEY